VQRGAEGLLAEVEIQERPRECIQGMKTTPVTSPMRRVLAFFLEPSMGESTSRATVILRGAVGGVFLVSEDAGLGSGVDEVEITRESTVGPSPQGARVVVWPPPRPGSM
jgi:hypothetical protein